MANLSKRLLAVCAALATLVAANAAHAFKVQVKTHEKAPPGSKLFVELRNDGAMGKVQVPGRTGLYTVPGHDTKEAGPVTKVKNVVIIQAAADQDSMKNGTRFVPAAPNFCTNEKGRD